MAPAEQGQSSGASWEVDERQGLVTVRLSGELDLSAAGAVQTVLEQAVKASPITVVDLNDLEFMDSTGLRVLAGAHKVATGAGGRFLLGRPSAAVLRVLKVSGLVEHFDYVEGAPPTERVCVVCDEAVTSFDAACPHCGSAI
jgi:anti-sigma B factor antagonist